MPKKNVDITVGTKKVTVHITYPNPDKDSFPIQLRGIPIDDEGDCLLRWAIRKKANSEEEIQIVIDHIVAEIEKKLRLKCPVKIAERINDSIDERTAIGQAFIEIRDSGEQVNYTWHAEGTRKKYFNLYENSVIPTIQYSQSYADFGKTEYTDLVDRIASKTMRNAQFTGDFNDARELARENLKCAYPIYAEMRYRHPELPDLFLAENCNIMAHRNREQIKELPEEVEKKFVELLETDITHNPLLVRASAVMYGAAARTAEAAAVRQNTLDSSNGYILVFIYDQDENGKVKRMTKSKNGNRFSPLDDWSERIIKKCNDLIGDEPSSEESPVRAEELSRYVKNKLIEAGLSKEDYVNLSDEYKDYLKSINKAYDKLETEAYILRRNRASKWRNVCGFSQSELDFCLGHAIYDKKKKNDWWNDNSVKDELNRKAKLYHKFSQPDPVNVSNETKLVIRPENTIRYVNNGKQPLKIYLRIEAAEPGEKITVSGIKADSFQSIPSINNRNYCRKNKEIIGE